VPTRSPARKALSIGMAVAVAGVLVWFAGRALVISGTKATFTFVPVKAAPVGGPIPTTTMTTTPASTTMTGSR
jgi:hypothetical protein